MKCLAYTVAVGGFQEVEVIVRVKFLCTLLDSDGTHLGVACGRSTEGVQVAVSIFDKWIIACSLASGSSVSGASGSNDGRDIQVIVSKGNTEAVTIGIADGDGHLIVSEIGNSVDVRIGPVDQPL